MGALGDSFYEYLLKSWVYLGTPDTTARGPFDAAIKARPRPPALMHSCTHPSQAINASLIYTSSPNNLTYIAELRSGRLNKVMGHLVCHRTT